MGVFQSFWFGKRLSPLASACIRSFLDHGHTFDLYTYDEVDVPSGTILKSAADILPRDRVFFYEDGPGAGSVSAFSNLFRYALLVRCGGWWVDTDVVCLTAEVPEKEYHFGVEQIGYLGTAIMRLPKSCALAQGLFHQAEKMGTDVKWGQAGPHLFTRLVAEHDLLNWTVASEMAYPIQWDGYQLTWYAATRPIVDRLIRGCPFLHLWAEMYRRNDRLDPSKPEPGSFLDALHARALRTVFADPHDSSTRGASVWKELAVAEPGERIGEASFEE